MLIDNSGVTLTSENLSLPDNAKINLGDSNDLQLWHDVTSGVFTGIIANNTGTLRIDQNQNDGNVIFRNDDGSGGCWGNDDTYDFVMLSNLRYTVDVSTQDQYGNMVPNCDVTIKVKDSGATIITFVTDSNGKYVLRLAEDEYSATVTKSGYESESGWFEVYQNRALTFMLYAPDEPGNGPPDQGEDPGDHDYGDGSDGEPYIPPNRDNGSESGTPGFEILSLLSALFVTILILRYKRNY